VTCDADPSYLVHPGAPGSPVILHAPHGSRTVPPQDRGRILLDDEALRLELDRMTDAHTAALATGAADRAEQDGAVRPWVFEHRLSRLVVDPERFPDEREEMAAVGMGAVYTRTSHREVLRDDDPGYAESLLARYFRPYADAMTALVDDRLAATGRAVVIDVHSYPTDPLPYELHAEGPRPRICLGTDRTHTPDWLIDAAREALLGNGFTESDIGFDSPFAGCYVPLKHYSTTPEVVALMLEIRRDVYMDGAPVGPLKDAAMQALCSAIAQIAARAAA
jgi:N-formylglutamate amidohydrolase